MSIRIALDNPPEFYTNLDFISGRVILVLHRPETIGNVIVKLEGESHTALTVPSTGDRDDLYRGRIPGGGGVGDIITESHKILYRLFQVYPDDGAALAFQPGTHEFKFNFKVPLNNICHDPKAMSALLGIGGLSGSGFRTMDGSKQLMLQHVKGTLPPSLTGFPQEAEIRYYIKVTIQRPGFFKENWRYQVGFKFLPVEPPRPAKTSQEAFARRPFTFRPQAALHQKKSSFFGSRSSTASPSSGAGGTPPSIEMSARLPFPSILTCNEPLPLRLIARKLAPTEQQHVYLTALEIVLVGHTQVRVHNLENTERSTWILFSAPQLSPPIQLFNSPTDPVDAEFEIPKTLWKDRRLPNTVAPSFRTCNLARTYGLEIMLTLTWAPSSSPSSLKPNSPSITLPLKLSKVDVYSGIRPPQELLNSVSTQNSRPPRLPNRPPQQPPRPGPGVNVQPPAPDPLYPPQLGTVGATMYEEAPPSYDEAMADQLAGPAARPAYSGVTAENAPSTMPAEKS
ncbi:uncharacterized protein F4822DRAFT_398640 [Hypoxylon trugodes]|uniref:uncharacterized protein n=1 Tax=Hypoxylon trugodes TaxID=326681 RepID=UPI00218D1074|nr:uncharacterized protein F4822DRAFT_398640 [Hypoxylon trugodes]KAI1389510.1 hypothetical protein F4822DRAFT_398640 [Hypoxylon trugodes]